MSEENADLTAPKQQIGRPFPKGVSGNPAGRPKGSLSVIGSIKKMFEQHPEQFEDFINKYLKDPRNRQHIVEMIDGKPQGSAPQVAVQVNNIEITDEMLEKEAVEFLESRNFKITKEE